MDRNGQFHPEGSSSHCTHASPSRRIADRRRVHPSRVWHRRTQWPQLARVTVRFRGAFAYVDGQLPNGDTLPLMRLRYGGSAARWGFAMYLASKDGYEDAVLPTGAFAGLPEDALDCAAGLYLGDPTS